MDSILPRLNGVLNRPGFSVKNIHAIISKFDETMESYGEGLSDVYNLLGDEYSKQALVEILAYRILGYRHVKLWTNTPEYWKIRKTAWSVTTNQEKIANSIKRVDLSSSAKISLTLSIKLGLSFLSLTLCPSFSSISKSN